MYKSERGVKFLKRGKLIKDANYIQYVECVDGEVMEFAHFYRNNDVQVGEYVNIYYRWYKAMGSFSFTHESVLLNKEGVAI